ncbi:hypothetical protein M0802_014618 [Mischocyttarus mexicanus]|nr:hypothetical protein M0802_014618 [Mischocyttarus mexicanus]
MIKHALLCKISKKTRNFGVGSNLKDLIYVSVTAQPITMDHSWFAVYLTLGCLVAGVLPQYRDKNTSKYKTSEQN